MAHYSFLVPSVWESANRLRFGVDVSVLRLRFPDRNEAVLTQMIRTGITAQALRTQATRLGVPETQVRALLSRLTTVLVTPDRPPARFTVVDDFRTGHRIAQNLIRAGCSWRQGRPDEAGAGTIALTVERFGYNPARNALLCARGFRVLPIRFTDRTVAIGPLLDDTSLCAHCLHLGDVEADAPWLRWPEQLIGKPIPSEHTVSMAAISAVASELMHRAGGASATRVRVTIEHSLHGDIHVVRREHVRQHPRCELHDLHALALADRDNQAA